MEKEGNPRKENCLGALCPQPSYREALGCPSRARSLGTNTLSFFEERWNHLNFFHCLGVKSYLSDLWSFKMYGVTRCIGSLSLAPHKVNTCLKANTLFEYKVKVKERPPPGFPVPWSPFKDRGGDLALCAGQMRVMADTGVNVQLKINRLDNYYMLLVPINLMAVLPLRLQGRKTPCIFPVVSSQVYPLCGRGRQRTELTRVIPSDAAVAPCRPGAPTSRAIKEQVGHTPCWKTYAGLC